VSAAIGPQEPNSSSINNYIGEIMEPSGRKFIGYFAAILAGLVIGYFAGREHLKYEMRTAFQTTAQEMQKNLASVFGGRNSSEEPKSTPKVPPPKPKEAPPLNVVLVEKGFRDSNRREGVYQEAITFSVSFTNLTDKDIRAFDGVLSFNDLLDNNVLTSSLAINDPVKANSILEWKGQLDYNQFIDSHQRMRGENQANLKVTFTAHKVLFADGTTKEFY
jgi:hypothetical protein